MPIWGGLPFLERFCHCEMECTQEIVVEFIELYKRKEIIWDPKHPMHFNKIKKQDAWEELGKEMKSFDSLFKPSFERRLSTFWECDGREIEKL